MESAAPRIKRRRILESDDEMDEPEGWQGRLIAARRVLDSSFLAPTSSPPKSNPVRAKQDAKGKAKEKPRTVNDLMQFHKSKSSVSTKPQPSPPKREEEEEADAVASAKEDDVVDQEDEEDALDGEEGQKAALTNAQLALSRIVDVDIDGGWKEGEP